MKTLHFLCFYFILSVQLNFGQINKNKIVQEFENKADTLYKYFKYDSASVYYCKAAEFYEQQQEWLPCAKNYRLTSTAKIKAAKFDMASYYSGKAFDLAKKYFKENNKDEMFEKSDILINMADIDEKKGKCEQELVYSKMALELIMKTDSSAKLRLANAWNKLGIAYNNLNNYDSAQYFCEKALNQRIELLGPNDIILAESFFYLGAIYENNGEYDKALELFKKALKIRIPFYGENHPDVADCYNNIGIIYEEKGEYDTALEFHQKALLTRITLFGENHPDVACSYNNIGVTYEEKGEYDKSLEYFQKDLKINISVFGRDHPDVASSYNNIGTDFIYLKEYDKALEYFQKALQLRISVYGESHSLVAASYNNIGVVYKIKRDFDKVLIYYQKALKILVSIYGENHPDCSKLYKNIGDTYINKGVYDKGLEFLQKALSIRISVYGVNHPDIANSYNYIGKVYDKMEKTSFALQYYQKALMSNIVGFNDSSVYTNPKLVNILSEPILLASLTSKAYSFSQLCRNKANSTREMELSLSTFELAFQLINAMRNKYNIENTKLLLSEYTKVYYAQAASVAMEYEKVNSLKRINCKSFEFIEKGKSSTLSARFNELNAKHFSGIPDTLLRIEKELRKNISSLETEALKEKMNKYGYDTVKVNFIENKNFSCSRKFDSLISYYETTYPAYYKLKYSDTIAPIPEIQKKLDKNTALLNYFVGDSSLFIVAITDSLYNIQEVTIDSSFIKLVTNYYKDIKTAETGSFVQESQELYQILIKPVKKYIAGKEHLVVIPDDYLYYVPFETLIDNTASSKVLNENYSGLDYLIKSHSISYHHSATLWYDSKKSETNFASKQKLNFIGFAPVFSKEKNNGVIISSNINSLDTTGNNLAYRAISADMKRFNPLPYSKDEVTSIVHLFEKKKKEATAYIYAEANEANFKNNIKNYSIIHVSSHGFSNDKEPDLSGIVFSQPTDTSDKEDGILYTGETYNLNLNADLIVLSSCESGLGKLIKGEGLQALSRGFLYAGAPNVIFSLWKALDKGTKDLMVQFYSNVLDGKSYSESLRSAKLKLINDPKTAFPHFWGGFVLIGR
jgi:CHAT domain-containing protein/Tfp pilus assembly protein PilF